MCCSAPAATADGPATLAGAGAPPVAEPTACVTNVQRYSLHDGGGIRTVVFCKGCPFRCPWCCNPENLSFEPEVSWRARLCVGCSARADGTRDASGCPCDTPPERCPTGAKEVLGQERGVGDVLEHVLRDRVFFEESGGGVTVSGGECLAGEARQRFVCELLARCRAEGVATAIETTLATPLADPRALAAACDELLVDFKLADRARSLEVCGIDPAVRDGNLRALLALGVRAVARMPIVPGFTDAPDNVRANARRVRELGLERADILPFHQLGEAKYASVGRPYACAGLPQLTDDDVALAVAICEEEGLKVVVRGE